MRVAAAALLAFSLAACAGQQARVVPAGYARIELSCLDGEADVTIDGAPAGKAKDYALHETRMLLRPGFHRIELVGSSGIKEVREAMLGAGDDVRIAVLLLPVAGGTQ